MSATRRFVRLTWSRRLPCSLVAASISFLAASASSVSWSMSSKRASSCTSASSGPVRPARTWVQAGSNSAISLLVLLIHSSDAVGGDPLGHVGEAELPRGRRRGRRCPRRRRPRRPSRWPRASTSVVDAGRAGDEVQSRRAGRSRAPVAGPLDDGASPRPGAPRGRRATCSARARSAPSRRARVVSASTRSRSSAQASHPGGDVRCACAEAAELEVGRLAASRASATARPSPRAPSSRASDRSAPSASTAAAAASRRASDAALLALDLLRGDGVVRRPGGEGCDADPQTGHGSPSTSERPSSPAMPSMRARRRPAAARSPPATRGQRRRGARLGRGQARCGRVVRHGSRQTGPGPGRLGGAALEQTRETTRLAEGGLVQGDGLGQLLELATSVVTDRRSPMATSLRRERSASGPGAPPRRRRRPSASRRPHGLGCGHPKGCRVLSRRSGSTRARAARALLPPA